MSTDHIRYDLLAQEALRGVVRHVLIDVAKRGLPGDHYFFISFDTRAPNVHISSRLREQHPEEMTVVLQHQFWDLVVTDDAFEVGLSFKGVPERLTVPFDSIKSFFDPSVKFGLKFEVGVAAAASPVEAAPGDAVPTPDKPARPRTSARSGSKSLAAPERPVAAPEKEKAAAEAEEPNDPPDQPSGGAEVVRLDRFRKK